MRERTFGGEIVQELDVRMGVRHTDMSHYNVAGGRSRTPCKCRQLAKTNPSFQGLFSCKPELRYGRMSLAEALFLFSPLFQIKPHGPSLDIGSHGGLSNHVQWFCLATLRTILQNILGQTLVLEKNPNFSQVPMFPAEASSHRKGPTE